jgi:phospholipid/cholesterol/gamma-HCH transport system substrate-binding protein
MNKRKIEFYVGLFAVIGIVCVSYLFIVLGEINLIGNSRYAVVANFSSVSGLKIGARVEMVGVEVGSVSQISIDKEKMVAKVELRIDKNVELAEDSIASVKTSGIIGQKYIDISPGASDIFLAPGEEIFHTEASLDIESLVRKYIFTDKK